MNELRRDAIIHFNIPIRYLAKILESVIDPIALDGCEVWGLLTNQEFTKWDKHQIETLHAEFCKNIVRVQRKTPNNARRAELGRYPLIIKIQKGAVKFYSHLKGSDSQTFHNKAITPEVHLSVGDGVVLEGLGIASF